MRCALFFSSFWIKGMRYSLFQNEFIDSSGKKFNISRVTFRLNFSLVCRSSFLFTSDEVYSSPQFSQISDGTRLNTNIVSSFSSSTVVKPFAALPLMQRPARWFPGSQRRRCVFCSLFFFDRYVFKFLCELFVFRKKNIVNQNCL